MAKKDKVPWKIPFDKETGELCSTYSPKFNDYTKEKYDWKENTFQFSAVMNCKYHWGQFSLTDLATERTYKMFMCDFEDMMATNTLVKGTISGNWSFRKQGQKIGIVFKG
jgi:hypothetical protein